MTADRSLISNSNHLTLTF